MSARKLTRVLMGTTLVVAPRLVLALAENFIRAGQTLHTMTSAPSLMPGGPTAGRPAVLLRLAYLGLTNTFALLRLLPRSNRDKDIEILALRHQIAVLQRQLGNTRVRFSPTDRALLAALLHRLPRQILHRLRLLALSWSRMQPSRLTWAIATSDDRRPCLFV
ncbi:hypothetical protein ACFQ1S_06300 [Kibdelosporangium lantanae]|uniref:Uncharacterized protein n=1 Tax=Kibdelosporangium lantanae TaxID=1497396 RepID=A0ABW3M3X6_9PSEU